MAQEKLILFIIDDDPLQTEMMQDKLKSLKFLTLHTFGTGELALAEINKGNHKPHIIILDYFLNSVDAKASNGLSILKKLKEINPEFQVIMVSGQDKIEVAVNCIKYGAFDYVIKNESVFVRLEQVVLKAVRERNLLKENKLYKRLFVAVCFAFISIIAFMGILWGMGFDLFGSKSFKE
jgi:DNA-binding NtrC family response regulator